MLLQMRPIMWILVGVLGTISFATAKPPPPLSTGSLWGPSFINKGFPPTASKMSSITVPYMSKSSSPFFPKFVDPKAMISKKTDMLANVFGGLGPAEPVDEFLHYPSVGASDESWTSSMNDASSSPLDPRFFYATTTPLRISRGIVGSEGAKTLKPPPPSYPGLAPIAEEPADNSESAKVSPKNDAASMPKERLAGFFGPLGPLDSSAAATEIPPPKSTIVPADFWLPSSIVPGPMEYTNKVSTFLNKLFDSLALNKTGAMADGPGSSILTRSLNGDPGVQGNNVISRSLDDIKIIEAAKDSIVDSILSELGDLKADMIATLNEMFAYQKASPAALTTGKPLKPVLSPFAAFFAPATVDPILPFKQRINVLSRVFDMLTDLQKNITTAVQDVIDSSNSAPAFNQNPKVSNIPGSPSTTANYFATNSKSPSNYASTNSNSAAGVPSSFNTSLLIDVIKSRLTSLDKTSAGAADSSKWTLPDSYFQKTTALRRASPKNPPTYRETYSQPEPTGTWNRDAIEDSYVILDNANHGRHGPDQYKKMLQMKMDQGYQSAPPGTIESVAAGGESVPGHQEHGVKMLDERKIYQDRREYPEWLRYLQSKFGGRQNHHNHG